MRWLAITTVLVLRLSAQTPTVADIVQRSSATNDKDFKAESEFNYQQTEVSKKGTRTSQVTMIDGSPYQRLMAIDGVPLSPALAAVEKQKQDAAVAQRKQQNSKARANRIASYQREQDRDHALVSELPKAFTFTLLRSDQLNGFEAWVLQAKPRPGYKPPTMQAQVLPGMQGELWIDKKTFEWLKVTAQVIRPVSIDGFLAQVQPGTEFEIEKIPVGNGLWQINHYSEHARARVLHLFPHTEQDEITFSHFELAEKP